MPVKRELKTTFKPLPAVLGLSLALAGPLAISAPASAAVRVAPSGDGQIGYCLLALVNWQSYHKMKGWAFPAEASAELDAFIEAFNRLDPAGRAASERSMENRAEFYQSLAGRESQSSDDEDEEDDANPDYALHAQPGDALAAQVRDDLDDCEKYLIRD